MPNTDGFLGIDAGTQGLSVVFTDSALQVLAIGEAGYQMVPDLEEGCYEQLPDDWLNALQQAMLSLQHSLSEQNTQANVLAIGISGQMHGEVLVDSNNRPLGPARLWCDSRNELEETELTELLGSKMPKRITAARWLWTIRNRSSVAKQVAHLTTPSGWLAFKLTGEWNLGIGDAAGMFPIDQQTLDYRQDLLKSFDELVADEQVASLKSILPNVRRAGEESGSLSPQGAEILGLPEGIPVAAAEGDQPASLAGSLIGEAGMVSVSFGTSVCANSVGDKAFQGVSPAVDHFCAPDGKPINMVWLRNGTTLMNSVVEMFGRSCGGDRSSGFENMMPQLLAAAADCEGVLALPFLDDEPGLQVNRGSLASFVGLNSNNATPGNLARAALLATMFNLKLGCEILDDQGFPRTELVLAGGLAKTPELAQILADVFDTTVTLLESAEEGTAWGAAVLAKYRYEVRRNGKRDVNRFNWANYLRELTSDDRKQFHPNRGEVATTHQMYLRYKELLKLVPQLREAIVTPNSS